MARKRKGERRHGNRWLLYARLGGRLRYTSLPLTATPDERDVALQRLRAQYARVDPASIGSFAADVADYGARIRAMRTFGQRMAHLALWLQALGRDRTRRSITTSDVDRILQTWLGSGLAPGTVRKRRTALQSFFAMLDKGTGRPNPVKDSANPRPPKVQARGVDYLTLERAIAAMPDHRDTKKGFPARVSLSKLRVRVLAYTGIPPGLLAHVTRRDLHLNEAEPWVQIGHRAKGAGVEPRKITLTAEGIEAFRAFDAAGAYGGFPTSPLNRSFKSACAKVGLPWGTVRLYDLRHSFLSQVYRVTRDLATVARLGLHAPGSPLTARYAMGANEDVDRAAVQAFSAALAAQRVAVPVPEPVQKFAAKVYKRGKRHRINTLRAVV